jgi:hypothetical protein
MNNQTVREMLQSEIESLPEDLAEEVFDFVLFMKSRHAEETFLWKQVEETRSYRQQHPEDVTTVTPEEWEMHSSHSEGET